MMAARGVAMARSDAVLRELEALRAELAKAGTAAGAAVGAAVDTGASEAAAAVAAARGLAAEASAAVEDADVKALLAALRERLDAGLTEAEDFAEDHPIAVAAAAFVLGVAVGRLWRGR